MKRYIILFCIATLFFSCKNDHKVVPTPQSIDVVGTWTLYSFSDSGIGNPVDVTNTQYPCLAEHFLKINSDSTTLSTYTGTDTCYVTPKPTFTTGATIVGYPGQAPISDTWKQSGNTVYIGRYRYTISNTGGHLFLSGADTVANEPYAPNISVNTYIKQ